MGKGNEKKGVPGADEKAAAEKTIDNFDMNEPPIYPCPFCGEDYNMYIQGPEWNNNAVCYEEILQCSYCGNRILVSFVISKILKLVPIPIREP